MESSTRNDTFQHEIELADKKPTIPQMRAMVMRADGLTFNEISKEINVPKNTVKNWFRPGTETYGLYKRYANEVSYLIGKQAIHELKMKASEAVGVLGEMLGNEKLSSAIRFRVASYILEKAIPLNREEEKNRQAELDRFFLLCERLHISEKDWQDNFESTMARIERLVKAEQEFEKLL